ncbi:FAT domain-containing protein, partial [Gamsiella multidivaricata]|uniref:FAT domain-containing protein n=1 Tax=Gamsiella multidivaricata TaxID=101098 RepID=UPI00221F4B4A
GLRPILMNLSDYKRLTVAGLEGLARLLELLTNYFKVEIGKKLLDHLRQWAEPTRLQECAGKPLSENQEIRIIVGILNVFCLLPQAANIFLDELVTVVLEMESHLRRAMSSPFRHSLLKFLNRYSDEAVDYFLDRLTQERHSRLFVDLLSTEFAAPLRAEIVRNPEKLIAKTFSDADPAVQFHGLTITRAISKFNPDFIPTNRPVLDALLTMWRAPGRLERLQNEDSLSLARLRESQYLVEAFILYLKHNQDDVEVIFEMISIFTQETVIDFSFLKMFYIEEIAIKAPAARKRAILEHFLVMFQDREVSQSVKMQSLRVIINPMLLVAFTRGPSDYLAVIDHAMITEIHSKIWQPLLNENPDDIQYSDDALRIELLQMTSLILQFASDLIADARKDIIIFGWNYLKLDDITGKQAAYVLIARFIAAYDTPSKIIIQIYVALLRAHQSEAKALVKQALDIVAPVLPKRIVMTADSPKNPTWARWTQRVLVEDGHSGSQLMNVYQLLVRHPDLFYESREHFLPQIVTTLSKLGLVQNAGMESRTLTINLAELILKWERRRISEAKSSMEVDTPANREASAAPTAATSSYTPNLSLRENVVSFLVRFACAFPEPLSKKGLPYRAVELLREFLSAEFWPEVNVKLQFLERTLLPPELTEVNQVVACNSLEVLLVLLENKSGPWFLSHITQLYRLLDKCLLSDSPRIVTNLQPIMDLIYKHISASAAASVTLSSDVQSFIAAVDAIINDGLQTLTNLYSVLTLIQSSCQHRQDAIDAFVPGMMKVVSKLTKDHIAPAAPGTAQSTGLDSPSNLLITALRLLKLRISHLGDQRRWYLVSLIQLIEKSTDVELSRAILDMATEWVTGKTETFPTIKEKASLMVKMMCLETRGDKKLVEDFLELVVTIYNDPSFARSELTVRLEQAFLMGTRSDNPRLRNQFAEIFDRSIGRSLYTRLTYVIGGQSWEYLGGQCWLQQALDILLGVEDVDAADSPELSAFLAKHREFLTQINQLNTSDVILPLKQLQHLDTTVTHRLWTDLFPLYWSATSTKERQELTKILIPLLAKEYHSKQQDARPNVIQALLEGISRCAPAIRLPPHLVKYLGKRFCAWHTATHLLQNSIPDGKPSDSSGFKEEEKLRNSTLDALAELYTTLGEEDMFYGLWRRRCLYSETNAAISYEQNGMWQQAQIMYESAVNKARTGALQFTESEYSLWEDHWITCTQKLQSWDILADLAKHENNTELLLESNWRLSDWTAEREMMEQLVYSITEAPTPRRRVFEAFLALIKANQPHAQSSETNNADFVKLCDEGVQLSLWKWHTLPEVVSQTHVPLLQVFQQFVELTEANQIYQSLASTTALNLESKSQDLKSTLQTWRERLPNTWDDINVWSDLVAWRQHIFSAINKTYLPLIQQLPSVTPGTGGSNSNSFAYRGYHETAWIINRFAHVARKHQLAEVCINQLTKIYTLPNIEIQEAFLKLREQAKCHFQNEAELTTGLEVINNTNLMYFSPNQKAEFFTMKGMFLAKLSLHEEANMAFVNAVQIDLGLAKAWAAWGNYNDQQFKEKPKEITLASHAVSCYLQAAGIYKSSKSRKYLVRIQWLMTQDDSQGTVYRAFEAFKGDVPVWYWITFIPQLLLSLTHLKEAKHARHILMKIAKTYPQALHFSLRTLKEEYTTMRKGQQVQQQAQQQAQQNSQNQQNQVQSQQTSKDPQTPQISQSGQQGQQTPSQAGSNANTNAPSTPTTPAASTVGTPTAQTGASASTPTLQPTTVTETSPSTAATPAAAAISVTTPNANFPGVALNAAGVSQIRKPWEHVDDIMNILKTAFPLLALSMESMVDQIQQRLKPSPEEDMYRLIVALLTDSFQQLFQRLILNNENEQLSPVTEANLTRFSENLFQPQVKAAFVHDFIANKPTLSQFVTRLQRWRDKFEDILDSKPRRQQLENWSQYLAEFQHQKFDDVEVPGQYLLLKDNSNDFVRIDRFESEVELLRGPMNCSRRLIIRGHDGSIHPFIVQQPASRQGRREERVMQLFRILNGILERKKESRKRNLFFHLPLIIPLAPQIRILQDDPSYASLHGIFEEHCNMIGIHKDDPIMYYTARVKDGLDIKKQADMLNLKMEIADEIASKMIPETILTDFMVRNMKSYTDLWVIRKQFTSQMASVTFLTYIMSIGHRFPTKWFISLQTGNVWTSDMLPVFSPQTTTFSNSEPVPFRFTPNIQHFITPTGVEGVFTSSLMSIARCLTEPEFEFDQYLGIFIRDELVSWFTAGMKPLNEQNLGERVTSTVEQVLKRTSLLSCKPEREKGRGTNIPANQTILDLISQASNPLKYAQMDCTWLQWL